MSYNRVRFRDQRTLQRIQHNMDYFVKSTCTASPLWTDYYSGYADKHYGVYESMSDTVVPNFKVRSTKGEIFFNPMTHSKLTIGSGTSSNYGETTAITPDCSSPNTYNRKFRFLLDSGTYGLLYSGFSFPLAPDGSLITPPYYCSESDLAAARSEAITDAWADRGQLSDANPLEDLADLNKSLTMISQALGQVNNLANKTGLINKAKAAGNLYLLYRYGLKPLVSDIGEMLLGLNGLQGSLRKTSRGHASVSYSGVSVLNNITPYSAFGITHQYQIDETISFRAMALDDVRATLAANLGFSLKSLLTLPWELIPYSFVVDWFANVGDYLRAVAPTTGCVNLGGCVVAHRKLSIKYQQVSQYNTTPSSFNITTGASLGSNTYELETRTRTSSLPAPAIVIKSDFGFDRITRIGDAAALIAQKLK